MSDGMSEETRLLKGADEGVCVHAGQVCMEPEGCGCPCSFCLAEADEAQRDEDDEYEDYGEFEYGEPMDTSRYSR